MRSGGRRSVVLVAAVLCVAALLWAARDWQQTQNEAQLRERGAALFHGELPLVARLQGHAQALPTMAVRCSNCHEAPGAAESSRPYAGFIQGSALTTLRSRRGGPPSVYDNARLCELLRTGVDPARVMIPNKMPRYDTSPADCAALWAYLRHEPT